jgi:D-alanyl-D-alanine endopeptidase (penicillin-binding protein 7)
VRISLILLILCLAGVFSRSEANHFQNLTGKPNLKSASALVFDAQGHQIYGKDIDTVRPIASITKLMTGIVLIDSGVDLEEKVTITKQDRDLIQLTGSRLEYGASLTRREMLLIAIMASENRAATVLGRTFPGGMTAFVDAMNKKARELGMEHSHFADPAGLSVENVSTASDLMKMLLVAKSYDLIVKASTTTQLDVRPYRGRGPLTYGNTNRLLKNKRWSISVSKTGYIMEAGRCLVMHTTIEGEPVSIVLLNSYGKLTPFGDSNRLRDWMLANS